jgi:hypothetical protein
MLILLGICVVLILASIVIRYWRRGLTNPITKKLSRSWSSAALWFGIVGIVLVVSRVESIQFLAMRFMWVLWGLAFLVYLFFQWRLFRSRHYEILPKMKVEDPRDKYLPKSKK